MRRSWIPHSEIVLDRMSYASIGPVFLHDQADETAGSPEAWNPHSLLAFSGLLV